MRAAASSIARGRPSTRSQIPAIAGAFSLVARKSGLTATARSMKSLTASNCERADRLGSALRSGTARGGECQQPGSAQQLPTLTHLVVTADETRHLRGQVVRCGFQGAQSRKFPRQPLDVELVQAFRAREIFEAM